MLSANTRNSTRTGTRQMGELNGSRNGRPSPRERREQHVREDERLKRDVDDALKEWDRLEEGDSHDVPVTVPAETRR